MSFVFEMPAAEYHRRPEVSHSQLKSFRTSPWDFWKRHRDPDRPPPDPQTPSQALGEQVHCAALEPQRFRRDYVRGPEGCTAATSKWKEFVAEHRGREVLKPDRYDTVVAAAEATRAHPLVQPLLAESETKTEVSIFFETCGVSCRARLDLVSPFALADWKTTGGDSLDFARQCERLNYHTQAAFYREAALAAFGVELPFLFVTVETDWPYRVSVYRASGAFLEQGKRKVRQWLTEYAVCLEKSYWPSYNDVLFELNLPPWSTRDDE